MIKLIVLVLLGAGIAKGEIVPLPANFIAAEIKVESGGNDKAIGDNGEAIGCLEIHKKAFQDAVTFNKKIHGNYTNCFNRGFSVQIITSYLNKYCKNAIKLNDFEVMSRTWNGGPNGRNNPVTIGYWKKVKKELNNK